MTSIQFELLKETNKNDNDVVKALMESEHTNVVSITNLPSNKVLMHVSGYTSSRKRRRYIVTIEREVDA